MNRRDFLGKFSGGTAFFLSLLPGTLFFRKKAWAQQKDVIKSVPLAAETLESVFKKTDKRNVYSVLQKSTLPTEDKLAILAMKEVDPDEIKKSMSLIEKSNIAAAVGETCGDNCPGSTGSNCGNKCLLNKSGTAANGNFCGFGCEAPAGSIGVVDRKGSLGIRFSLLNKEKVRASMQKAFALIK